MDKEKLIKVSTYAREREISTTMVYKMIANGSVKCREIDGVKFIVVSEEDK